LHPTGASIPNHICCPHPNAETVLKVDSVLLLLVVLLILVVVVVVVVVVQ
jgi:hypothetical protein